MKYNRFDFEVPVHGDAISFEELAEILDAVGFNVKAYWKGNVEDRSLLLTYKEQRRKVMPLNRPFDWRKFSDQVDKHIDQYTIPQYQNEDNETDQVGAWTAEECLISIQRYVNRNKGGNNARGVKEALRDMLKIAHYAQFAFDKIKAEHGIEEDIYF